MLVTTVSVNGDTEQDFALGLPGAVQGQASLADRRPLAGAIVEGVPQSCYVPPAQADGGADSTLKPIGTTPLCLPRPQQTVTAADGSFVLPVDPGSYALRVRPQIGTALPWTTQTLDAGTAAADVVVPAPFHVTFELADPSGAPIAHALVQAFYASLSSPTSPAVELGETLTDGSGQVDLYLALPR
jgi:hypothetical protein